MPGCCDAERCLDPVLRQLRNIPRAPILPGAGKGRQIPKSHLEDPKLTNYPKPRDKGGAQHPARPQTSQKSLVPAKQERPSRGSGGIFPAQPEPAAPGAVSKGRSRGGARSRRPPKAQLSCGSSWFSHLGSCSGGIPAMSPRGPGPEQLGGALRGLGGFVLL